MGQDEEAPGPLTEEAAIRAAREAIHGRVELSGGGGVRVEHAPGRVVVEFGRAHVPGVRGPDYDARVTLDAGTGEVIDILGGS